MPMSVEYKAARRAIRAFWPHYTDERLSALLAHAQDGKLSWFSCCCLVGVVTAVGALAVGFGKFHLHDPFYREVEGGEETSRAFYRLGIIGGDEVRRRRIIPMIRAEMRRRAAATKPNPAPVLEVVYAKA